MKAKVMVCLGVLGGSLLAAYSNKPPVAQGDQGQIKLLPVIRLVSKLGPQLRVPIALTNSTEDTIRYAVDHTGTGLYCLHANLYQDGKEAPVARIMYDLPAFRMKDVRELKRGASVVLEHSLPYINVKAGRYELRLVYQIYPGSVDETKHTLTPMKLEQTMLLDIRAE